MKHKFATTSQSTLVQIQNNSSCTMILCIPLNQTIIKVQTNSKYSNKNTYK